jgi:hypothetical protein
MKKTILILFILLIGAAMTVSAGGDKNRGDKGEGAVHQVQVRNSEEGTPAFD